MEKTTSVIDMFKDMAESLFVDKQAEEELKFEMNSQRSRLRQVRQTLEVATDARTARPRSESLLLHHRLGKRPRLIAYTRCGGFYPDPAMQRYVINQYCKEHGYAVSAFFESDVAFPITNLTPALDALLNADGLIVSDLNRLVEFCHDPARELIPLIHDNFFRNDRYLISVDERINTSTTNGQNALIHHIHRLLRAA